MLESFMEDLLWRYPDDFFPRQGFKQTARQFTLSDAGRLDISFRDASDRLWVIEVKAIPIRTEVADQVYRYAQKLREAHPNDPPIPAVVAPVINATVREHFDRWGIEHFEIPEATFRRVATERGVADPVAETITETIPQPLQPRPLASGSLSDTKQLHLEFWTQFHRFMQSRNPTIQIGKPSAHHYFHVPLGRSNFQLSLVNDMTRGVTRLHFDVNGPLRDERYARIKGEHRDELEAKLGKLKWIDEPPQVRFERSSTPSSRSSWHELNVWLGDNLDRWVAALRPIVSSL